MPLTVAEFIGAPDGMNLAVPAHELPDTMCRYLQDGWLDEPGMIRRRGALIPAAGTAALPKKGCGLVQAVDPSGTYRLAALNGDGSTSTFSIFSTDYTSLTNLAWNGVLTQAPYYVFDAKPALNAGTMVATSKQYSEVSPAQTLALWRGGSKANYSTGTVTVTRGSKAVTGSGTTWTTNVSPGMFLFATADDPASTVYIGVVASVGSNTAITLEDNAPFNATAKAYTLQSLRGLCPKYIGRMTVTTTSTAVTGQNTKFQDNSLGTGDWRLYRARDMAYVGKVSSVTDNTTLVLTANAAVALTAEHFVALKADGSYSMDLQADTRRPGFLNAVYAGRQFYANNGRTSEHTTRLWFSDLSDPEAMDLSENDGDFLQITSGRVGELSTPIMALTPTFNSLLVLKENEAFALSGSTPDQFQLRKLGDEGTLSGMSVQQYQGQAIFAGRTGIYRYDGVQIVNLVEDRLGDAYKKLVRGFDLTTSRMWSMIARDHYVLFIESVNSPYDLRKGSTKTTPTRLTISIYLPTGAVTMLSNVDIRGAVTLPSSTTQGTWILVNNSTVGKLCAARDLFDTDGPDQVTCDGNTAGPDFYLESKRYNFGAPLLKKLFKQIALHYWLGGADLKLDTIVTLNEEGITSSTTWPVTILTWTGLKARASKWSIVSSFYSTWAATGDSLFAVKRIKFLKRSQHFGFRIWQSSASVTKLKLGPWSLGYKTQRPGRI